MWQRVKLCSLARVAELKNKNFQSPIWDMWSLPPLPSQSWAINNLSCVHNSFHWVQLQPGGISTSANQTPRAQGKCPENNTQLLAICEKFGLKNQLCTMQCRSLLNPNSAPVKIQVLSHWGRDPAEKINAEYTAKDYIIMQKHWAQSFRNSLNLPLSAFWGVLSLRSERFCV